MTLFEYTKPTKEPLQPTATAHESSAIRREQRWSSRRIRDHLVLAFAAYCLLPGTSRGNYLWPDIVRAHATPHIVQTGEQKFVRELRINRGGAELLAIPSNSSTGAVGR